MNLPSSVEVQHNADWVYAVSKSICVFTQASFRVQCMSTEQDCEPAVWPAWGRGLFLWRLSHGCKSSLLEQWLELTAVPVTYSTGLSDSSYALCCSLCGGAHGAAQPYGMLEMCQSIQLFSTHYDETWGIYSVLIFVIFVILFPMAQAAFSVKICNQWSVRNPHAAKCQHVVLENDPEQDHYLIPFK